MIEKIYCISLKDNVVRRKFMIDQLENMYPEQYKIVDACTIRENKVVESFNNLFTKKSNIDALSQIAICYSHLKCLKKIISKKYTYGAIIEDDIRIDPDIKSKLCKYIENTPGILNAMKNEPCMIHICGPSNFIQRENKFIERGDHIIVNICFYIVNYKLAKILVDNFYPIKWQFDTYVSKTLRKYNIKEYIARPILSWDLSSTLYSRFWKKDDVALRQHMTSTSKIEKIDKTNMKPSILFENESNNLCKQLFEKIINNKKKNTYHISTLKTKIHYVPSTFDIENIGSGTIIAGQGVHTIHQVMNKKPFAVLFVRGPLTRKCMIDSNIHCPDIYMDPLVLIKYIEKKKKIANKKYVKYVIITNYDINQRNNRAIFININNVINIDDICQQINYCDIVISNIYYVLIMATAYNKVAIPIKNQDGTVCIEYIDYILGFSAIINEYEPDSLEFHNIDKILEKIDSNMQIYYPQINQKELEDKCEQMLDILPYAQLEINSK